MGDTLLSTYNWFYNYHRNASMLSGVKISKLASFKLFKIKDLIYLLYEKIGNVNETL